MPANALVLLVTSTGLLQVGQAELSELKHNVVGEACSFEEALTKIPMIENGAVNVVVIDADHLSEEAEKFVARLPVGTCIVSWSSSQSKFPWAKNRHATKPSPLRRGTLAMVVSLAS